MLSFSEQISAAKACLQAFPAATVSCMLGDCLQPTEALYEYMESCPMP
jgi:hypothetical protein